MSYMHYWSRPPELEGIAYRSFVDDVQQVISLVKPRFRFFGGIKVVGPMGVGPPVLTGDHVQFNGLPMCETFWIPRRFADKAPGREPDDGEWHSDFVNTNALPYDVVVTATLTSFRCRFPDRAETSSDGGQEDWQAGLELYGRVSNRDTDELWNFIRQPARAG